MLEVADKALFQPVAGQAAESAQSLRGMRAPKLHLRRLLSSVTIGGYEKAMITCGPLE